MSGRRLFDDDEAMGQTLRILDELAELLDRERKHIVVLDHHALPALRIRKTELLEDLRHLQSSSDDAADTRLESYSACLDKEALRKQLRARAERVMLQARANQFLQEQVVRALQIKVGQEPPDDAGVYDGRARKTSRAPRGRKRAA